VGIAEWRKSWRNGQATSRCYDEAVSLHFDAKRVRAYKFEFVRTANGWDANSNSIMARFCSFTTLKSA